MAMDERQTHPQEVGRELTETMANYYLGLGRWKLFSDKNKGTFLQKELIRAQQVDVGVLEELDDVIRNRVVSLLSHVETCVDWLLGFFFPICHISFIPG